MTNIENLCKLCLKECDLDGNLSELLINDIPLLNILEKIIYNLDWAEIVMFPNKICSECLGIVQSVHQLNEKCLESDARLKKLLTKDENGEIIIQEVAALDDNCQILKIEKSDDAERETEMSLNESNAQKLSSVNEATVEDDEDNETRLKHKCQHCEKTFDKASRLLHHIKIHDSPREPCYELPEEALLAYNMKANKDVDFQKFLDGKLNDLARHEKIHLENKSYKCLICSKTFTQGSHLIDHLNRHNNLRPHVCQICNKGS